MHEIMGVPAATEPHAARLGPALCLGGALLGAVGLLGWLAGVDVLVTLVPGLAPIMPNAAMAFMLLGVAAALRRANIRDARRGGCGSWRRAVALAIGLVTLAEYAFNLPFSIDQLLVRTGELRPYAGRPSPLTAFALALLASAILLFDRPSVARAHLPGWFILCTTLIALTALLGQLFGAGPIYRTPGGSVIAVALPTVLSLLMISVGLFLERPDAVILRLAAGRVRDAWCYHVWRRWRSSLRWLSDSSPYAFSGSRTSTRSPSSSPPLRSWASL